MLKRSMAMINPDNSDKIFDRIRCDYVCRRVDESFVLIEDTGNDGSLFCSAALTARR